MSPSIYGKSMSPSPVKLSGFGYLEPLTRPVKAPTQSSRRPAFGSPSRALPARLEALTSRLATQSNWLPRMEPATLRTGMADASPRSPSPRSALDMTSATTSGLLNFASPHTPRPQPTVARTEHVSTLQERRIGVPNRTWHVPASPEFVRPPPGPSPEEVFATRREWAPVSYATARDRAESARKAFA